MLNTIYIFKPSEVVKYTSHIDPVQGLVDDIVTKNPRLFEGQLRFFACFTSPPSGSTEYDRAGLIYRIRLDDDDPLKACSPFELFKEMNRLAKRLGVPSPRNPSIAPAVEIVGPTMGQYHKILDFATSETFDDLGAKLPEEVTRFVALMCSDRTLDTIILPHLSRKKFNLRIEVVCH